MLNEQGRFGFRIPPAPVLPRGEAAAAQAATVDGDAGGAEAGPDDTPAHVLPTAMTACHHLLFL